MIIIPKEILDDMIAHAKEQAPLEACGLLAGIGSGVHKSFRLTNVDAGTDHFSLDPKEQFAVVKNIRPFGWEIVAVYHSHPATPARMSDEDLRLAFTPDMRYVIISLMDATAPEVKCYKVCHGQAVQEPILATDTCFSILSREDLGERT